MDQAESSSTPRNAPASFDDPAAEELFNRYAVRLSRLAERHLHRRLRARVGGDDVVQSVFHTFFKRSARGEFQIDNSAQLWRLLVRITLMRVRRQARYHTAEGRDVKAENQLFDEPGRTSALPKELDPAAAIELVDRIESLLDGLPPIYSEVLQMRLQGHSADEIAKQQGVSRRTVYRALELLQGRLAKQESLAGG